MNTSDDSWKSGTLDSMPWAALLLTMAAKHSTGRLDIRPDRQSTLSIMFANGMPCGVVVESRRGNEVSVEVLEEFEPELLALFMMPGDSAYAFFEGADMHTRGSVRAPRDPFAFWWSGVRSMGPFDTQRTMATLDSETVASEDSVLARIVADETLVPVIERLRESGSTGRSLLENAPDRELAARLIHLLYTAKVVFIGAAPTSSLNDIMASLDIAPPKPAQLEDAPPPAPRAPALSEDDEIQQALDSQRHLRAAHMAIAKGDVRVAEAEVRKANALDPQEEGRVLEAWIVAQKDENLGQEGTRRAITVMDSVVATNPQCERALFYRGMLHKRLGFEDLALSDFEKAHALRPAAADAAAEIRVLRLRSGDTPNAGLADVRAPESPNATASPFVVSSRPPDPNLRVKILGAVAGFLFVVFVVEQVMFAKSSLGTQHDDDPSTYVKTK